MAIHMRKGLGGAQPPRALAPARTQAACQGVDRHLSKPPTFTARWRRSANRVVKGPSPKGTATARLRRIRPFAGPREGRILSRLHYERERNRGLVQKKKKQV